ncbi:MAG TPA: isocitrate/isopropylmalate dehydrogenase family protein [Actinomycetota bacterium]|nr:isocitrate/isopropylmalate dehydrogenase family protein [Actinomycetota bacterium]
MAHRITLIPGDGIGPEVVEAARLTVEAAGVEVRWDVRDLGAAAFDRTGRALPEETLGSVLEHGAALKGPVDTPAGSEVRNVNVALRQRLDLYANVRPCRRYPGVPSRYGTVDLLVIRENTEDTYTGIEFEVGTQEVADLIAFVERSAGLRIRGDSGISVKAISEAGSDRIVRFAFEEARRRGRRTVTAAHKANIMKRSDGLFLEVARRVAAQYPDVGFDDRIIDALCMQLVSTPERFDVLVLPNLYGDIVAELGAGLIGGSAVAPGAHVGDGVAVFEPTHGTARRLAGRDRANPVGMLLSAAMLLRHVGESEAAARLEGAVVAVLADGDDVTADLRAPGDDRPAVGTRRVGEAVRERLGAGG